MYSAHTSNRGVELLDDRLAQDPAGELLTSLLHQLEQSKAEIAEALDQPRSSEEQGLLQGLQQAVHSSESMLRDVWQQLHQRAAPC
jgi:Type III secretion system, cytoplasmic E component of needle